MYTYSMAIFWFSSRATPEIYRVHGISRTYSPQLEINLPSVLERTFRIFPTYLPTENYFLLTELLSFIQLLFFSVFSIMKNYLNALIRYTTAVKHLLVG